MIYTCDTKCCHFIFFGSAETRVCPDCGKKISVFGESHLDEVAKEYGIPVLAQIPIRPAIAKAVDEGTVEYVEADFLDDAVKAVKEA